MSTKFRIVEHKTYDNSYYYIERFEVSLLGLLKLWVSITEYEPGDDMYPGSKVLKKFDTIESAEEYIYQINYIANKTVVKEITI